MYEEWTNKYKKTGIILNNNKMILFHYLKYMFTYSENLLNNKNLNNKSISDSINLIISKNKKEIDEIDFNDIYFKEKIEDEELLTAIQLHVDIINNNEINIGLLKTRIKHMWDYVGCCNECMLTIDKLCCYLDAEHSIVMLVNSEKEVVMSDQYHTKGGRD